MARLRLTIDNDTGPDGAPLRLIIELADGERCIVGRSAEAQISCKTGACSRQHCAFGVDGGALYLEDLGSSNGTWLNGQRVKRSRVSAGDTVHAGQPKLQIVAIDQL